MAHGGDVKVAGCGAFAKLPLPEVEDQSHFYGPRAEGLGTPRSSLSRDAKRHVAFVAELPLRNARFSGKCAITQAGTKIVGTFPNDDAIVCLVGALLLEHNDEWAAQRARCMTLETMNPMSDDPLISLPPLVG